MQVKNLETPRLYVNTPGHSVSVTNLKNSIYIYIYIYEIGIQGTYVLSFNYICMYVLIKH